MIEKKVMKPILITLFTLTTLFAPAQQITIVLPHFAGKEYVWFVHKGDKQDTLARGVLNAKGQTVLTVPPAYQHWRGMSNCLLAEGGGLDIILNGENNFTAGCDVAQPTIADIYYEGSAENSFLLEEYIKQQQLLNKAEAISAAIWAYTPDEPLHEILLEEKERLEKQFAALQREIIESPLYAARIRQMADYCQGIGSRLDLTEQELTAEQRRYVREVLDFEELWSSGFWRHLFANWIGIETALGDNVLLTDSKAILARVKKEEERKEKREGRMNNLLEKIVKLFHQYEKEGLLVELGMKDLLAVGNRAPKLYLPDNSTIVPRNCLIFFYESDCNSCENEMLRLRGNYQMLQEKNIRVISVSADMNEEVYRKNADLFPWQQKIYDSNGPGGVNFKNYNVMGTPMFFWVDDKGVVVGRYSSVYEAIGN